MAEELKKFARWLAGWALAGWLLSVASMFVFSAAKDDTDPEGIGERSGLTLYTDHLTGCQYLGTRNHLALTPRNGVDYEQVGCRYKEHK